MHWFWRATIAGVVGIGTAIVVGVGAHGPGWLLDVFHILERRIGEIAALIIILCTPTAFAVAGTYALLTHYLGPRTDLETRCRKCRYILRGISEPRCPECGERI
jgi:hypothetical protein